MGRFRKRYLSCNSLLKKKSCYDQYFLKQCSKHASRIERYTSVTIDEVEKPVLSVMCSNWLMWLWLTKSFNKQNWIAATAVLFNTHIKTNILASWWIMMMLGCITTIKWWKKLTWSALGFKLGKLWEAHITELAKMPWASIYLTALELGCPGWRSAKPYFIRSILRTKWAQMEGFRRSTRRNRMPWNSCEKKGRTNGPWLDN